LEAKGEIFTSVDSDAISPVGFVQSIIESFWPDNAQSPLSQVLMHYEWRSPFLNPMPDPPQLRDYQLLKSYPWYKLWPNVGACMSARVIDAIRFGGFDEDEIFRGYLCGLYDLAWRLINAGLPEYWHEPTVALWHFAHENSDTSVNTDSFEEFGNKKHVDHHALEAVVAFSTGRILPLLENADIFSRRMGQRVIGTEYEEKYAKMSREALTIARVGV
jgi:hypothetical protein